MKKNATRELPAAWGGIQVLGTWKSTVPWARILQCHCIQCYTTVLEGDVSNAKREASVEWWKKITEPVQKDLGWSSENQLAKEENDNAKLQWCTETRRTNTEEIDKANEDVDRLPTTIDQLQVEITQI